MVITIGFILCDFEWAFISTRSETETSDFCTAKVLKQPKIFSSSCKKELLTDEGINKSLNTP